MIKFLHDGNMYNPTGGSSSVFKKEFVNYIFSHLPKNDVRISIGALPNSSPHFGTITTFSIAFSLAQRLKILGKNVIVMVGMVDTATLTTDEFVLENVGYQKSISYTRAIDNYIGDFEELLGRLSFYFGDVDYKM